jgi:DDE superfamily endonuclease
VAVAPLSGMRVTKVTDTRKKEDFAHFIRDLVDLHFPDAICIQLVLDNLNTHFKESLITTFSQREANRLLKKVRFIYTPKHGSWLNMAEIEINIMDRQCTGTRVGSKEDLEHNVTNWSQMRNRKRCSIEWKFTRQDADKKLSAHYVA